MMNATKKSAGRWWHGLVENSLDGMQYLIGVYAINEDMAQRLLYFEATRNFGDESMFIVFRDWLTEAEAEASGLDEF